MHALCRILENDDSMTICGQKNTFARYVIPALPKM